jgi:hypothetical protein
MTDSPRASAAAADAASPAADCGRGATSGESALVIVYPGATVRGVASRSSRSSAEAG